MTCDRGSPNPEDTSIYVSLENGAKRFLQTNRKNQFIDLGEGIGPIKLGIDDASVFAEYKFNQCSLQFPRIYAEVAPSIYAEKTQEINRFLHAMPALQSIGASLLELRGAFISHSAANEKQLFCFIKRYEGLVEYEDVVIDLIQLFNQTYRKNFYGVEGIDCKSTSLNAGFDQVACNKLTTTGIKDAIKDPKLDFASLSFFSACQKFKDYMGLMDYLSGTLQSIESLLNDPLLKNLPDEQKRLDGARSEILSILEEQK